MQQRYTANYFLIVCLIDSSPLPKQMMVDQYQKVLLPRFSLQLILLQKKKSLFFYIYDSTNRRKGKLFKISKRSLVFFTNLDSNFNPGV